MKKLLVASAVALFGLSNAQIAKGTVYLSGSVGYSQEETNNGNIKSENFNVLPTAGFFVAPNFAVGLGVGFQTQKDTSIITSVNPLSTTVNTREVKNPAFVVAPFARKYWTLSDKLYFFGQLAVPMQFGKTEVENSSVTTTGTTTTTSSISSEAKYTSVGVTVKPGLDYFLNKNWTIEATIGEFGYNNFKPKDGDATNNYSFGLNLANVGIGVKYVFAK
ncbi:MULTISPECIES: outer membrane beta-barrel protein [Chryseobacterium]|jgi:opacity protein-like surface antigen|uniref:Opacity protein n=2 Tax=Chryseobacterium aquaticum TaxID=452084 RepID=A0A0Q3P8D9_9FLAO|nr:MULTISPECIES: outer membrane beta-barrel protein [Chryseobacterium]KNB60290.1 opacity protein [Chryseobacterium sp. Hurlbut01]KQK25830.1 opacity protein [Chryseobacterium aquaticum]KUJ55514.1 opacity protein [Chryseobacterium aquaticum subsp. greenlandense]NMR32917.1 porin family protein [Chryseobacterium aquaticum]NRQ45152.1 outer membrane beta-barrel protein [Chryseobacterium sp. C-204]